MYNIITAYICQLKINWPANMLLHAQTHGFVERERVTAYPQKNLQYYTYLPLWVRQPK